LPCDVQQLFENRCIACHLGPPGAVRLLTFDDLTRASTTDPNKSLALISLERMRSTTSPMPPPPVEAPEPDEIATLEAWVSGGMPRAAACTPPVAGDGGAGAIYDTPTVCTSKTYYRGDQASENMQPGEACITCHTRQEGPSFRVAGTVYPTAHEPNDCNGIAGGVSVVVSDKNDRVLVTLPVNGVGNFFTKEKIRAPFRVKVVRGTAERRMGALVTAGDCNSCHTEKGVNGAPGRIMAP
jgi:mono/diheme cytochrome c family protein